MKKILVLLLALFTLLAFSACKNSSQDTNKTVSSDNSNTSTESKSSYTEENAKADANKLFDILNSVDKLGGSAIDYDELYTFTQGKATYCRVTAKDYTSVEQIKKFMEENLTGNLINGRYVTILGTETPCYIEKNGELYVLTAGKGCGFVFTGDATVSDFSESGFNVERPIDNYNAPATLKLKVVIDNDKPKIDAVEIIQND